MSFAVTPGPSSPSTRSSSVFGFDLQERLRGEDVLDLAGADAERQGAERAVRRGVAVAADDRHAGLRVAELGTHDVDDALVEVPQSVVLDAELRRSSSRACRSAAWRSGRRSAGCGRWSGRCGRPWRWSAPAGGPGGRPCAAPRTPAGWSPRGPVAGRCRGSSAGPLRRGQRGCPRFYRTGCGERGVVIASGTVTVLGKDGGRRNAEDRQFTSAGSAGW